MVTMYMYLVMSYGSNTIRFAEYYKNNDVNSVSIKTPLIQCSLSMLEKCFKDDIFFTKPSLSGLMYNYCRKNL